MFVHDIDGQTPVLAEMAAEEHVRVGLAGTKPIVMNGIHQSRVPGRCPVAGSCLDVVIRIETEIPVWLQIRPASASDREKAASCFGIDRCAEKASRRRLSGRHESDPAMVIIVLITDASLIKTPALPVTTNPSRHRLERMTQVDVYTGL